MLSDIEIAQSTKMKKISEIAASLGLYGDETELYGNYKAKITLDTFKRLKDKKNGKLILVTAVNPTPAGEGKTTTTVGLGQAMTKLGRKAVLALREPSLGPVFGIKGGAAGGGYSQVVPMEDINLHFTGDMHAISAANNLLCAMIDNHIHQGNELDLDVRRITFKRVVDMNDRALRKIVVGLGGAMDGFPREDGFNITVASEVMAILCLSESLNELKEKLGNILVGYKRNGTPVFCKDLNAQGAMATLLKDALKPNLVQTIEGTPCFMHGGPFANIAHGCNSVLATKLALKLGDYCITEAGFGSDLGAEKFFDIKCRKAGLVPSAVVLVATVRALKYNGGVKKQDLGTENLEALKIGSVNLKAHIDILKNYNIPIVVAVNRFPTDSEKELEYINDFCRSMDIPCALSEVFAKGGDGGIELANLVLEACEKDSSFNCLYKTDVSIEEKIQTIVSKVYGGSGVTYDAKALKEIQKINEMGFSGLPICMAKTQYSLSDNPARLGRPKDFNLNVRELRLSSGAGFIVAITGDIMTMPGLPKCPAAQKIDIDENGVIYGLF